MSLAQGVGQRLSKGQIFCINICTIVQMPLCPPQFVPSEPSGLDRHVRGTEYGRPGNHGPGAFLWGFFFHDPLNWLQLGAIGRDLEGEDLVARWRYLVIRREDLSTTTGARSFTARQSRNRNALPGGCFLPRISRMARISDGFCAMEISSQPASNLDLCSTGGNEGNEGTGLGTLDGQGREVIIREVWHSDWRRRREAAPGISPGDF